MHIEPTVIDGAKVVLSYGTAAVAGAYVLKQAMEAVRQSGALSLAIRSVATTALVFIFFEVLP
ncbi:MAG: cobalt transporter, partial [Pseudomonadota bacterium]